MRRVGAAARQMLEAAAAARWSAPVSEVKAVRLTTPGGRTLNEAPPTLAEALADCQFVGVNVSVAELSVASVKSLGVSVNTTSDAGAVLSATVNVSVVFGSVTCVLLSVWMIVTPGIESGIGRIARPANEIPADPFPGAT